MAEQHNVKGYEGFLSFIKDFKAGEKVVNILFTGEKDSKVNIALDINRFQVLSHVCDYREFPGVQIALKLSHSLMKLWTNMESRQF